METATVENTNEVEETMEAADAVAATTLPAEKETKDMGNGVILEKNEIKDGKWEGAQFWIPQFKDYKSATEHFAKLAKSGKTPEEIIIGVLNGAISFRLRSQATAVFVEKVKDGISLPKIAEFIKATPIVITEKDAMEYIPGAREVDALSGLRRQKEECKKAAKKYKDEGKLDLAREKIKQYKELDERIKVKEAEENNELMKLLEA